MIVSAAVVGAAPSTPYSFRAITLRLRPLGVSSLSTHRLFERVRNKSSRNPDCRRGTSGCRAELSQDAPFAAAIGACVLSSLIFPVQRGGADDGEEADGGPMDSTDARFAVMAIVSFIPYFNWMSWVFAWLDSERQRYLVYSVVYLAPYLRTNLSLSPEESWLPIASILVCILHVQLEASIRNGDLDDIRFLNEAWKLFSPLVKEKEESSNKKGRNKK